MKLVSFETAGHHGRVAHLGALVTGDADTGELVDLGAATRALLAAEHIADEGARRIAAALVPSSLLGFIEGGARSRGLADEALATALERGWDRDPHGARIRYDASEITHLPAISDPPLLRDFMAFEEHLLNVFPKLGREIPDEWYRRPVYYKGNPSAVGAHEQDVAIPTYADRLDLEFEFAAIIGRAGVDIPEEDALSYIFGYTVYDDFSARDIQEAEMTVGLGPAKGKDFLGAHVLGPVVVTADELGDPYALRMTAFVNGVNWTDGSSADMHWKFEQMIAYASRDELVRVGEVFGSGTVGHGSGVEQSKWLEPGDVVELTVEGIGTLRNRVVATQA
ncbi:fumarylacetoacetate hydrolase family protein [Lacisediminihabitans profunda]|uniref:Fumarylacetoacetate hydrolase family protein n=1 Tax=Lacisediminihabitans profunda TaxID=2594790 RepID=A0A5C8UNJ6_9MICO|nr:fumarylacetoacetate hydrolase family protein [Lacisediminihabitans profunda]TXN29481.1 fumarylacetoacetate hydrolase family protein [Lacisediminihabitans profunda]